MNKLIWKKADEVSGKYKTLDGEQLYAEYENGNAAGCIYIDGDLVLSFAFACWFENDVGQSDFQWRHMNPLIPQTIENAKCLVEDFISKNQCLINSDEAVR